MKIVFAALHFGYFRNLESVVEELAHRGHHVHLVAERADSAAGGRAIVERLAASSDKVTFGTVPGREDDNVTFLASKIRLGIAYLRYLEPPYDQTPALVRRAQERTPLGVVHAAESCFRRERPAIA
jgi:NAD(P)-dependent dehydrogenase (short-subunit alcohol dehydrogenase family)